MSERRIVDLSHRIHDGLVTYPGLPTPVITPHLTRDASRAIYAEGTTFDISVITLCGNTGTYLDAPFHRYEDGPALADLPLETLVDLPALVVHAQDAWGPDARGIGPELWEGEDVRGKAVLIHTGWDAHFGTPAYATGSPFLTVDGTRSLIDGGAVLVGIDALNIDDTQSGGERPVHSALLDARIHVVEHLTRLGELPTHGARFTAVPAPIERLGTFPVRAFAVLEG